MMLRVKAVAVSWFHTVLLGTSPDESLVLAKWTELYVRATVLMVIVQNPRYRNPIAGIGKVYNKKNHGEFIECLPLSAAVLNTLHTLFYLICFTNSAV